MILITIKTSFVSAFSVACLRMASFQFGVQLLQICGKKCHYKYLCASCMFPSSVSLQSAGKFSYVTDFLCICFQLNYLAHILHF